MAKSTIDLSKYTGVDPNDPFGFKSKYSSGKPTGNVGSGFGASVGNLTLPSNLHSSFTSPINPNNYSAYAAGPKVPKPSGLGFDLDTFNMAGNALGGIGKLASGWAAIKGLGLAKKQLAQDQEQFNQNFDMQKQAYNANINQYNAKQAGSENWWKETTKQGQAGTGLDQFKRLELA